MPSPAFQVGVPEGKYVNAKFYRTKVLQKLKTYFRKRPAAGLANVRLPHDNASSHITSIVLFISKAKKIPQRSNICSAQTPRYRNIPVFYSIPEKDFEHAFKEWIRRLKACISDGGIYFKGTK